METPENIAIDFLRVNLGSYLTRAPGCDLEWMKLIISISGVKPDDLANVFIDMDGFGDKRRYRKIFKICCNAQFDTTVIR
jgi:hypothetical protein